VEYKPVFSTHIMTSWVGIPFGKVPPCKAGPYRSGLQPVQFEIAIHISHHMGLP